MCIDYSNQQLLTAYLFIKYKERFRQKNYANSSLSLQVLCCKHCVPMYFNAFHTKLLLSAKYSLVIKIPRPLNPTVLVLICKIFPIFFVLLGALNVRLYIQLSIVHYPSHRLSKFGQIQ